MSLVAGSTVSKIWSELNEEHKNSISEQLNEIILELRALNVPENTPLGGVCGEGCKDTRRHTRVHYEPITTCAEFEYFIFSNPHFRSPAYISLLWDILPHDDATMVFTHGDLRPDNIMVERNESGNYVLMGILDWEISGFYPDYFECLKATNNMLPSESDDWYEYIPPSASPRTFSQRRSIDMMWDVHMA